MGKASTSKKVARAASTGGGRTRRGDRPWGWYMAISAVVVLGCLLIVTSRNARQTALNPLKSTKPRPPAPDKGFSGDHWHAAYGVYLCDQFAPPVNSDADPLGLHTHGDGIVHIHPFRAASAGRKATMGVFTRTVGMTLTETSVKLPGDKLYKNGDKCGDKAGKLKVLLNGDERTGDPRKIRLRDRDHLVIAFVPAGVKVPESPPSVAKLDALDDVGPQTTQPGGETGGVSPPISLVPGTSTPGAGTPASSTPAPSGTTATSTP